MSVSGWTHTFRDFGMRVTMEVPLHRLAPAGLSCGPRDDGRMDIVSAATVPDWFDVTHVHHGGCNVRGAALQPLYAAAKAASGKRRKYDEAAK